MSNSLRPHGLQHARLSSPSLSLGVYSNSCPLSWRCHPTVLSSVTAFSSCPLNLSYIKVFSSELALNIRWPKYWSFSFSINPSNEYQGSFPLGLTGLISLQSKRLQEFWRQKSSPAPQFESIKFFSVPPPLWFNSHIQTWPLEKS